MATIVSCKYRMYSLVPRLSLRMRTKVTESWAGPGNKNITRIRTVELLTLRSYGQGRGIEFDFTAYCLANHFQLFGISNELGIVRLMVTLCIQTDSKHK